MDIPIEWLPLHGRPEQLIALLHDWGSSGAEMAPLARALQQAFPQAAILAPDAPLESVDNGRRRQWYAPEDLTPQNWPARVDAALPGLASWVQMQQQRLAVGPAATALGGFSQGAIVALALAVQNDGICGRLLAFGGCLTRPLVAAPRHTTVHLLHGSTDDVVPADGSRQALVQFGELQGDATLDIADGIGHELHPVLIDCALHRLRSHIPLRTWQTALGAAPSAGVMN